MDLHSELNKNMDDMANYFRTRMDKFDKALAQTQTGIKSSGSTQDSVSALAADFVEFKHLIWKSMSMFQQQLKLLVTGFDRHEVLSRRKILLFHGIVEDANEEPESKISSIFCDNLKLTDVSPSCIDICHRLGVKKDKPRPILVRFSSLKNRNLVWSSKTSLKGSGITVSEFLTKPRHEVFLKARHHFGVKNCWSADGTIMVSLPDKSRKKVLSMSDLQTLIDKYPPIESAQDPKPSRSRRTNKK